VPLDRSGFRQTHLDGPRCCNLCGREDNNHSTPLTCAQSYSREASRKSPSDIFGVTRQDFPRIDRCYGRLRTLFHDPVAATLRLVTPTIYPTSPSRSPEFFFFQKTGALCLEELKSLLPSFPHCPDADKRDLTARHLGTMACETLESAGTIGNDVCYRAG
jgi:hypothetical protein